MTGKTEKAQKEERKKQEEKNVRNECHFGYK